MGRMDAFAHPSYCTSPFAYARRPTRRILLGDLGVGGEEPIRVQSMTTPATTDVPATVDQIQRLVAAGCEIVRVTVPSSADAAALPEIRRALKDRAIHVPLVADIHFSPQAALLALPHVEKIRINPGNFADKKRFQVREYTDAQYQDELDRLALKVRPLVMACKERGVALRIGANHGSLSDRILNRYGDTPLGMVESALEFVRICRDMDYHQIVLSMKSSHPMVAIQAYRLLAARMADEEMDYPFHLGVTEAGDGEDGRVKSAVGIGSLLLDGLGDTVRVSLTEDPVAEIPVAQALVRPYNDLAAGREPAPEVHLEQKQLALPAADPYTYSRRPSLRIDSGHGSMGAGEAVRVEALVPMPADSPGEMRDILLALAGAPLPREMRTELLEVIISHPDQIRTLERLAALAAQLTPEMSLGVRATAAFLHREARADLTRLLQMARRVTFRVHTGLDAEGQLKRSVGLDLARTAGRPIGWVLAPSSRARSGLEAAHLAVDLVERCRRAGLTEVCLGLEPGFYPSSTHAYRMVAAHLDAARLATPLILIQDLPVEGSGPLQPEASLPPAVTVGGLLCDGLGDAVRLEPREADGTRSSRPACLSAARNLAFTILQGSRIRIVKTEFISCPSCGRTQFDLEETTRRIKRKTGHLKGLKIAVMGCIVNGPGEMADADFGYVGWGEDKIALFVGREMVARNVPLAEADERLVDLIRRHGRWIDPPSGER